MNGQLVNHLFSQSPRQIQQLPAIFQAGKETLRNSRKSALSTGKGAGKNGAGLILTATIDRVEYSRLEVIMKPCSQIVSGRELVIDRAGQAVNKRNLPGRLDANIGIDRRHGH